MPFHSAGWRLLTFFFLGYLVVTLLFTYPLTRHLESQTPALGLGYAAMANASLIDEAWQELRNPLVHERILYPTGYTLHEGFLPSFLVWLGSWKDNYLLGWNFLIILGFIFAGLGASLLVYAITGLAGPSFLAGLFFAFSASQASRFAVYPLVLSGFLPLSAYAVLGFLREKTRSYLLLWATCFALGSLSSWYFGVFIGLLTGLVWLPLGVYRDMRLSMRLGLATVVSGVFLVPFTPWALLGDVGTATGGYRFFVAGSADLLSLFTPPQRHWLLAAWIQKIQKGWLGNSEINANYLGTISLLLGLVGLLRVPPELKSVRRVALLWLIVGLILALGPELQINGARSSEGVATEPGGTGWIRLPYAWLMQVFPFSATRTTARYSLLALLAVVVGIGLFLARLWVSRPRFRPILTLLTLTVFGLELWPYWPQMLRNPEFEAPALAELARRVRPDQTVLVLPFHNVAYRTLWLSSRLPSRVMGGAIDKPSERFRRYGLRRPFFRRLLYPEIAEELRLWREDVFQDQLEYAEAFFKAHGTAYVILCKWNESLHSYGPYRHEHPLRRAIEELILPYTNGGWEDEDFNVCPVSLSRGSWIYPALGTGWSTVIPHPGYVERRMEDSPAELLLTSSESQAADLSLTLSLGRGTEGGWEVRLGGRSVAFSLRPVGDDAPGSWELRIDGLPLSTGENQLEIACGPGKTPPGPVSLRSVRIAPSSAQ
ncbi:MAG: hypothetical protein Kow00109_09420 [Acidobacteriota bacterium]